MPSAPIQECFGQSRLGEAKGTGPEFFGDGQGSSDGEDGRSCCCGGRGEGLGSEDGSSRVALQSVEEHSVWLLSLWAQVTELQAEREALSEVLLLPSFRGARPARGQRRRWAGGHLWQLW